MRTMSVPNSADRLPRSMESFPREAPTRSEEHTSELQSLTNLVCRLLLEKKKVVVIHDDGGIVVSGMLAVDNESPSKLTRNCDTQKHDCTFQRKFVDKPNRQKVHNAL